MHCWIRVKVLDDTMLNSMPSTPYQSEKDAPWGRDEVELFMFEAHGTRYRSIDSILATPWLCCSLFVLHWYSICTIYLCQYLCSAVCHVCPSSVWLRFSVERADKEQLWIWMANISTLQNNLKTKCTSSKSRIVKHKPRIFLMSSSFSINSYKIETVWDGRWETYILEIMWMLGRFSHVFPCCKYFGYCLAASEFEVE